MREFQCSILHMLHYEIKKIRVMPDYAIYVKDYLAYLKPYINIKNDPALQLDHLNKVLEDILYLTVGKNYNGKLESGEIGLPMEDSKLVLPCGIYSRWEK